jgi:hypothetical protein
VKISTVEPVKEGGPFARALRVLEKIYPRAGKDIDDALSKLSKERVDIPYYPNVAIIPGLAPFTVIKVRVRSTDAGKGRRGGFRVLLLLVSPDTWRLLFAYAKNEREDMSRDAILKAIRENA